MKLMYGEREVVEGERCENEEPGESVFGLNVFNKAYVDKIGKVTESPRGRGERKSIIDN